MHNIMNYSLHDHEQLHHFLTQMHFEIFKSLYRYIAKTIWTSILFIITTMLLVLELHFSWLLLSKAYFKVCFEVKKISRVAIFFRSIPILLGTNIPNDIASYIVLCITKSFCVYSYSPNCTCLRKRQMGCYSVACYSTDVDTQPIPATCTQCSNPTDLSKLMKHLKLSANYLIISNM